MAASEAAVCRTVSPLLLLLVSLLCLGADAKPAQKFVDTRAFFAQLLFETQQ